MFSIGDKNDTLSFRLEDKDNAFKEGTVTVTDEEGNKVINGKVEKENSFNYEFKEDVTYTILVNVTYDLDSDKLNDITGQKNLYKNEQIYTNTFKIESDYEFSINNVTITDAIEKGQKPTITFDSENNKGAKIDYIVIKDEEHDITQVSENHYEITLEKLDTQDFGKYYIDIQKIVLDNLKVFEKEKDYNINELTYTVLKNAPTVDNIEVQNNSENKNVSVTYKVNDDNDTLEKLNAVLVDSTDKILDTKEISKTENKVDLSYGSSVDRKIQSKIPSKL